MSSYLNNSHPQKYFKQLKLQFNVPGVLILNIYLVCSIVYESIASTVYTDSRDSTAVRRVTLPLRARLINRIWMF